MDLFQFQQSEIIAPGCSVLDANRASNVKRVEGEEKGRDMGPAGKTEPIFRALING